MMKKFLIALISFGLLQVSVQAGLMDKLFGGEEEYDCAESEVSSVDNISLKDFIGMNELDDDVENIDIVDPSEAASMADADNASLKTNKTSQGSVKGKPTFFENLMDQISLLGKKETKLGLKEFFKDMDSKTLIVSRKTQNPVSGGHLLLEMEKGLTDFNIDLAPTLDGNPMKIYGTILTDVKRNDLAVYHDGGEIINNLGTRADETVSKEEMTLTFFNAIKAVLAISLAENNLEVPEDKMNVAIHRALASRTQTFDVEMWQLINDQRKDNFELPLVKIHQRLSRFDVKEGKIAVSTETIYTISLNDAENPNHGMEIGKVSTVRSMEFDPMTSDFTDETFTLQKK